MANPPGWVPCAASIWRSRFYLRCYFYFAHHHVASQMSPWTRGTPTAHRVLLVILVIGILHKLFLVDPDHYARLAG